jgi:Fe-Mn family superoxide dismutase
MHHALVPIPCKPWMLNGLSERLLVSHYENEYGTAVRSLNAIQEALGTIDVEAAPGYQLRAMKEEELAMRGSVVLHEAYFGALGGDGGAVFTGSGPGTKIGEPVSAALEQQFGGMAAWRREFVALAHALAGRSGWIVLSYARSEGRLYNQIALDHTDTMIDAVPLLALDMYEHAYHIDFGANASAYIDAFMRNINWTVVNDRLMEAHGNSAPKRVNDGRDDSLPSVSVEELATELAQSERIQVLDARPKHYFSRSSDMMKGATWRDPDRVDEWSQELSRDAPVVVYCAYGYSVGCDLTTMLRERGFDAKYVRGGLAAWYAAGGERALKPRSPG